MSHSEPPDARTGTPCRARSNLDTGARIITALALLLLLAGLVLLFPQWRHNPDLSHGWFTPLLFVVLLHEARSKGAQRFVPSNWFSSATIILLAIAGLGLLGIGSLYTAALEATHALVALVLTAGLCTLLAAVWVSFALNNRRLIPLNWPAGTALLLWMLSSPLPPGTYARLTAGLQLWVTGIVLGLLHLLGIAAVRTGNIIELANTAVGVEEACSGVRSLISCLYVGLFFSAVLLKRPGARVAIIALSAPLALAMNVVRSLLLTLLANAGMDISGVWHDLTGFGILAATAGILAWLATVLARHERVSDQVASEPQARVCKGPLLPRLLLTGILGASAILLLAVLAYPKIRRVDRAPAPEMAAVLPEQYPGWTVTRADNLYRFSAQLHTDRLVQRTYATNTTQGTLQLTVYVAYWSAGDAPISLVALHTPDACWPGAGWTALPTQPSADLSLPGRRLEGVQHRLFERDGYPQHVWYWHLVAGRPIETSNVRSPRELLKLAWQHGFMHEGPQVFVRVSSNRPWEDLATEPLTQEIFARLSQFGF